MPYTKKDKIGSWIIGAAAAVIVIVVAITYTIDRAKKVEVAGLDSQSLCAISEKYRHTIVLVDKTDPFSPTQRDVFLSKVRELKATLEQGERLSIYVLDDHNYRAPKPSLSMCNPGSGRTANPLYQNPRQMQQKFDRTFGRPLDQVAQEMIVTTTQNSSPIIEMIYSISQLHDFGPNQPYRRLVIFSDLMQNTTEFSHFPNMRSYSEFRRTDYARRLRADLRGDHVEVVYLLRPELYQIQQSTVHQNFWGDFFQDTGVASIDFRRVG